MGRYRSSRRGRRGRAGVGLLLVALVSWVLYAYAPADWWPASGDMAVPAPDAEATPVEADARPPGNELPAAASVLPAELAAGIPAREEVPLSRPEQLLLDLNTAWQASGLPTPPSGWLEAYARAVDMPCARVELEGASQALRLRVLGTGQPQVAELQRLTTAVPGVAGAETEILPVDAPVCPLLDLLNRRTLPSPTSLARLDQPLVGGCAHPPCYIELMRQRLRTGEQLVLTITSPPVASHLTVDFIAPDGTVTHLFPVMRPGTDTVAASAFTASAPAGETVWIGDERAGPVTRELTVQEPVGRAFVLVLAAPAPLFEGERPAAEPLTSYRAALEEALADQPGAARPLASLLTIQTLPAP